VVWTTDGSVSISGKVKIFSLLHSIKPRARTLPGSYLMDTVALSPGGTAVKE
jgi:hypothetical protein